MKQEIYELFKKYGAMMASQPYPVGEEARLLLDTSDGVYGTRKGANLSALKESDVVKMSDAHFGTSRSGMHARVISQTPYCQRCLREGKTFRAVLDDMAQIVGPEAVIVNTTGSKKSASLQMAKAVQKATGFFVQDRVRDGQPAGYTLTIGRNLYEAVVAMTVLEKSAEIALKAGVLGGGKPIPKIEARLMREVYKKKYSKAETEAKAEEESGSAEVAGAAEAAGNADFAERETTPADREAQLEDREAQSEDREARLRQMLVDYGNRLVACGLVQGTWGNISVRLDDRYMLATPSGLDYSRLTPEDMVKVDIETLKYEGDLKPTSEKGLHAAVYQRRPEIGAVIHTHAKYCCVFAAANQDMPIEDREGQKIFGTSVKLAGYGLPGSKALMKHTANALGDNFGCIMANHGMLACGSDLEKAFNNCQMLEQCAETYINRRFK
ncbi:MAG: class II aldolase/adducin family protein [Anaerovoracaceae bacterium]|nr:class II aldolase/adducin family protein [Anaerovoracaceae bacterium]